MNGSLRGLPVTFFGIHILGGLVLFMTEGIMVSELNETNYFYEYFWELQVNIDPWTSLLGSLCRICLHVRCFSSHVSAR